MSRQVTLVALLAMLLAGQSMMVDAKTTMDLKHWRLTPQQPTSDPCCSAAGHEVSVPSTILGSLVDIGAYNYQMSNPAFQPNPEKPNVFDPFFGQNLKLIGDTPFNTPWEYSINVTNPTGISSMKALLVFEGLNYRADIYVNGHLVGDRSKVAGALAEFTFDISGIMQGESTNVRVVLVPGSRSDGQWRTNNTDLAISFEDWNPHPQDLTMGLWKPVRIDLVPEASPILIEGLSVSVSEPPVARKRGTIAPVVALATNHSFVVRSLGDAPYTTHFVLKLNVLNSHVAFNTFTTPSITFAGKSSQRIAFPDAFKYNSDKLWEPRTRNRQITFTVADKSGNIIFEKNVAYRHVRHEFTPQGSLKLIINGKYHQIQGAGWNPDMFMRIWDERRLEQEFQMADSLGINTIRLEGMLMHDRFYELADTYGIMIIPGWACCTGWEHWSVWPQENYAIAKASAITQARIISSHASVIAFMIGSDNLPPPVVETIYNDAFAAEAFTGHIISSASQEMSPISGNPGVKMVGPYSWVPPNYWLSDNPTTVGNYGGAWGFLSEGGPGESPMNYHSWKRTVPPTSLWNASFQPNGDGSSLDESWSWHVGNPNGHFRSLQYYTPALNARYGSSKSAPEFCYKAQLATYESIRSYMESYRRNSQVNATGYIQWMLNNAWPSHLWHLYDYYLVGGGEFYATKVAMRDVTLMMSYNDGTVWMDVRADSNYLPTDTADAIARIFRASDGKQVWESTIPGVSINVDRPTPLPALTIPINGGNLFSAGETFLVQLTLNVSTPVANNDDIQNWYWVSVTKDVLDWPASNGYRTPCLSYADYSQMMVMPQSTSVLTKVEEQTPGVSMVTVTNADSNNFALGVILRMVYLSNDTAIDRTDVPAARFSDGYFVVRPQESRKVALKYDPDMNLGYGVTWTVEVNWMGKIPQ